MELIERPFGREEWTGIVSGLPGLSLMQTWEYAEAKAATGPWKPVRAVIRSGEKAVAAFQGIARVLPVVGGGLLWINRAPLLSGEPNQFTEVLSVIARWARQSKMYVRVAPPFRAGMLESEPFRVAGFRQLEDGGWYSSIVDLSVPADELRKRLDQKWRNQLNKALRNGVTVEWTAATESFERYIADYTTMLKSRQFKTTVTPEFLTALQEALPENRRMTVFTARHAGRSVGANVIAVYGDTAEYCSGSIADEGRSTNAGNALLWAAITEMQRRGLRRFDVGGMHPVLTPKGILDFKLGVSGTPYCLENEIETTGRDWRSVLIRSRVAVSRRQESA